VKQFMINNKHEVLLQVIRECRQNDKRDILILEMFKFTVRANQINYSVLLILDFQYSLRS